MDTSRLTVHQSLFQEDEVAKEDFLPAWVLAYAGLGALLIAGFITMIFALI